MMDGVQLDRRLAEAVGYRYADGNEVLIRVYKDKSNVVPRYFRPHEDLSDAWEVGERLGSILAIEKTVHSKLHPERERYTAYVGLEAAIAETAPMAICLAALKVIEKDPKHAEVSDGITEMSGRA